MGLQLQREKPSHWLVSAAYRFNRLLRMDPQRKMRLFLDLEWIFDRLAHEQSFALYDSKNHPFREDSINFIRSHVGEKDSILDFGCKEGDLAALLAPYCASVVGIDTDQAAIQLAEKKHRAPNVSFLSVDGLEYLESSPEVFSVCLLSNVLEHQDDPINFLKTLRSYFKSFYLEVPDYDRYYLNRYRKDVGSRLVWTDNDHTFEFDRTELKALLDSVGLTIVAHSYKFGMQKLWLRREE